MENYSKYFQEIVQNTEKGLIRGIELGTPIEAVKKQENAKFKEQTEVITLIKFTFSLVGSVKYEVHYYYDSEKKVDMIDIFVEYDKAKEKVFSRENFDALTKEFDEYLEEKYGRPATKKKFNPGFGTEIYKTWIGTQSDEAEVEIIQMYYGNNQLGKEKIMKLEFQFHY